MYNLTQINTPNNSGVHIFNTIYIYIYIFFKDLIIPLQCRDLKSICDEVVISF